MTKRRRLVVSYDRRLELRRRNEGPAAKAAGPIRPERFLRALAYGLSLGKRPVEIDQSGIFRT